MSTLNLENIKHPDSASNNISVDSSGNTIANGKLGVGTNAPVKGVEVQSSSSENDRTLRLAYDGTYYLDIAQLGAGGVAYRAFGGLQHSFDIGGTERMRIDSAGRVTMPYQPVFSAMRGSAGAGTYPTSDTIVDLGETYYNTGSHYNTSNYRFTAPVSGYYQFSAGGTSYTSSKDDYITLYLKKNGSPLDAGGRARDATAGGSSQYVNPALFATVYLNSGDYVELWNYSGTGTVSYHPYEFHFEGRLVG